MQFTLRNISFLIIAGVMLRIAFAVMTPAWQAPDEYGHYWVSEQIALNDFLPESAPAFPASEAYQPPLYYWLASLIVRVISVDQPFTAEAVRPSSALIVLRMFSVLLAAATLLVTAAWLRISRWLTDTEKCTALAFVAFLPSFIGISSTVNNDILVIFLASLALYYGQLIEDTSSALPAGFWAGVALLAKVNAILVLPYLLLIVYYSKPKGRRIAEVGGVVAGWSVGAVFLLGRNLWQYGDPLAINPGLLHEWSVTISRVLHASRNFAGSFLIAFGRVYQIKPPAACYVLLGIPLFGAALMGWARSARALREHLLCIGWVLILGIVLSLTYTLSYSDGVMTSWGKNLFPLLPLCAVVAAVGWNRASQTHGGRMAAVAISIFMIGIGWGLTQLAGM